MSSEALLSLLLFNIRTKAPMKETSKAIASTFANCSPKNKKPNKAVKIGAVLVITDTIVISIVFKAYYNVNMTAALYVILLISSGYISLVISSHTSFLNSTFNIITKNNHVIFER
jgi:hypothetical protein